MSTTAERGADFLEHFGVKGMKWGVRKSESSSGGGTKTSSTSSKFKKFVTFIDDVAFEFSADSDSTRNTIAYEAGKINKPRQKAINQKYEASGKNKLGARLKSPRDPDTKAYRKESRESFVRSLEEAANRHTNASGTRQYTITDGYGGKNRSKYFWTVRTRPIQHADSSEVMLFEPIFDANGLITDVKYRGVSERSMAQSDEFVSDYLKHFGVKGMRWGIRNNPEKAAAKAAKKTAKADAKFEKITVDTWIKVNNNASAGINSRIPGINNKPEYKGMDFNKESPTKTKYEEEMRKMFEEEYNKAAKGLGTNASGTREYYAEVGADFGMGVGVRDVKHSEPIKLTITRDENGFIINVQIDTLVQSDEFVGDFLAHYGVKGMRWGVRKSDPVPSGETRITQKGKKLKGEGGKDIPAHPDARRAAESKQKAKGSGLQALSNKELKDLQTRMNLEQNVRELTVKEKNANANPAAKFIKRTLLNSGKNEVQQASNRATSKAVANMMKKR